MYIHVLLLADQAISYMVVATDVQQAVERYTILTVFKAEGLYPVITVAPTLSLHCKHCTHVH